jgi:hypothetical protein
MNAPPQLAEGDYLIKLKIENRSRRLLRLIDLQAPATIISRECALLQQAIDEVRARWGSWSETADGAPAPEGDAS